MDQTINQSVGIDISKATFTACVCKRDQTGEEDLSEVVQFKNLTTGFNQFVKWSRKITDPSVEVIFVMEATGVYYENLAHHLHKLKQPVSVLLPNKVKHFGKSLNVKTKTDQVDARIIARLGAERRLSPWYPPPEVFKQLRDLTRGYTELMKERTVFKNRLDAMSSGYKPLAVIMKSHKAIIKKLEEQLDKIKGEIERLIYSEEWLASKVDKVLTIKGVGLMTVATILAETQGFELVQNIRQLCSYAGYDVVQRESGTSVMGKTRISKKGNSWIRGALHFPALVASRHNPVLKKTYLRINKSKASKMVGVTAIQRKILILIYTLWKKDEIFDENYKNQSTKMLAENGGNKAGRGISSLPAQDELQPDRPKLSLV
jgi:transposase